jgi:hypothetical protein
MWDLCRNDASGTIGKLRSIGQNLARGASPWEGVKKNLQP